MTTLISLEKLLKDKRSIKREEKEAIAHHKGYHGRKAYYPFKMDEWKKAGLMIPKNYAQKIDAVDSEIEKLKLEIEQLNKGTIKGPSCAICLDNMYSVQGPLDGVSFNKKHCKKHIFHHGCISDGRIKSCPICRDKNKKLTYVDVRKFTEPLKKGPVTKKQRSVTKDKRARCPNGTRKDTKSGKCLPYTDTKGKTRAKCPNGTRKNSKTQKCEKH